jgi:hypothetical protein
VEPSCVEFSWDAGESTEHFNNVCDNVHGISVVAEIQRRISRRKFPGFLQGFVPGEQQNRIGLFADLLSSRESTLCFRRISLPDISEVTNGV